MLSAVATLQAYLTNIRNVKHLSDGTVQLLDRWWILADVDFEVCDCLELIASFVSSLCLFGSGADAEWQMAQNAKPVLAALVPVGRTWTWNCSYSHCLPSSLG